ncbi:exported hypothetical protein [Candidatus Sulfotelmatomonas gaucii]|uniref:Carboxypeptidase regulatory-like domain-containing protein n=1 Tax=Candidatus Sulfuritelmatomonas gaucii TaxID=2043161 RepID=A0A2N9LK19_9BACT|nr:exported hypothetical protein [Candidatus Sulfotelmatomonas gaucii]
MRASCFPALLFAATFTLAMTGCSSSTTGLMTSHDVQPPVSGAALQGKVHGGQNPIAGASVYLYAANTTGYGGAGISATASNQSISLLTSGTQDASGHYFATTGSDGSFSVTGDYTCPSANSQLYLYAGWEAIQGREQIPLPGCWPGWEHAVQSWPHRRMWSSMKFPPWPRLSPSLASRQTPRMFRAPALRWLCRALPTHFSPFRTWSR